MKKKKSPPLNCALYPHPDLFRGLEGWRDPPWFLHTLLVSWKSFSLSLFPPTLHLVYSFTLSEQAWPAQFLFLFISPTQLAPACLERPPWSSTLPSFSDEHWIYQKKKKMETTVSKLVHIPSPWRESQKHNHSWHLLTVCSAIYFI